MPVAEIMTSDPEQGVRKLKLDNHRDEATFELYIPYRPTTHRSLSAEPYYV